MTVDESYYFTFESFNVDNLHGFMVLYLTYWLLSL